MRGGPTTDDPGIDKLDSDRTTVRVLIVDDQVPFREAARAVIARIDGFELVGLATSGEESVLMANQLDPDLIVMDINMTEMDGLEATRRITARRPAALVVLVSTYAAEELPSEARHSGAAAYLSKDDLSPRELRRLWEAGGDAEWRIA